MTAITIGPFVPQSVGVIPTIILPNIMGVIIAPIGVSIVKIGPVGKNHINITARVVYVIWPTFGRSCVTIAAAVLIYKRSHRI